MARTTGAREDDAAPPATALQDLPAWATTGVGSLPHTFPEPAAAHAVGEYDVPFCPQLPRLEGDMVEVWLGPARSAWGGPRTATASAPPRGTPSPPPSRGVRRRTAWSSSRSPGP
ncbi:MAG: hypothetical protein QOD81_1772 [Solirubrobacteraceae bacterium]|nr:hypothetical protein [Solirubrobacteraceae bacterium]